MNRGKAHVQWLAALAVLMLPFGTIIACEVTGFSFNERV